jgi:group II intron reverse transcriptase/maturase
MRTEVVERRLSSLADLSRRGKRINGLFRLLACPKVWETAYEAIAPNKGSLTPGIDPKNTLDGISLARIEGLMTRVMDGTYRFSPVRRVNIPKPNGKTRPLGLPTADDKLVQAAVKLVLEQIYEPVFSERSHGFRPEHSCHTALDHIQGTWHGVVWLVEVDVEGFFDNIDHDILLRLLEKRIDDARFLKLIKGMLKAGYMADWRWHATFSGTPQGGVISPLLANIYLHELDEFMETCRLRFDRGQTRKVNPDYSRLQSRANYYRRYRIPALRAQGNEPEAQKCLEKVEELLTAARSLPSKDLSDPGFRRLRYVRYADDFLIGVIGTKQEARDVMDEVKGYLAQHLSLKTSEQKSGIRKADDGASFLGYTVRTHTSGRVQRQTYRSRPVLKRDAARSIQLHAPLAKLAAFAEQHRLGNLHENRGTHRPELAYSSDAEIIVLYNSWMRGLAEYYKLGTCWKDELSRVYHIWWFSLVKTLACKHKCSIVHICDKLLSVVDGDQGLWFEANERRRFVRVFKLKHIRTDRINRDSRVDQGRARPIHLTRADWLDRLRASHCEACGPTDEPLEVHHARRLNDVAHLSLMARMRSARHRKRIVLCRPCHYALHAGTLQARLDHKRSEVEAG